MLVSAMINRLPNGEMKAATIARTKPPYNANRYARELVGSFSAFGLSRRICRSITSNIRLHISMMKAYRNSGKVAWVSLPTHFVVNGTSVNRNSHTPLYRKVRVVMTVAFLKMLWWKTRQHRYKQNWSRRPGESATRLGDREKSAL